VCGQVLLLHGQQGGFWRHGGGGGCRNCLADAAAVALSRGRKRNAGHQRASCGTNMRHLQYVGCLTVIYPACHRSVSQDTHSLTGRAGEQRICAAGRSTHGWPKNPAAPPAHTPQRSANRCLLALQYLRTTASQAILSFLFSCLSWSMRCLCLGCCSSRRDLGALACTCHAPHHSEQQHPPPPPPAAAAASAPLRRLKPTAACCRSLPRTSNSSTPHSLLLVRRHSPRIDFQSQKPGEEPLL
jgi:hypothetical protein